MQETRTIEIVFRVENIDELASDSKAVRQEAILSECLQAGLPGGDSASCFHRLLYYGIPAMLLRDTLLLNGLIKAAYFSPLLFGIVSVIALAGMNTLEIIQQVKCVLKLISFTAGGDIFIDNSINLFKRE